MFGDNLSFISDTTIVATRTQGCEMSDKFKVNFRIALPVAILTAVLYVWLGLGVHESYQPEHIEWVKVLPYLVVLVAAIAGMNVMLVLFLGILLSGITGLLTGAFDIWAWNAAMGNGITGMGELIIVTLLAGGMLEMIRYNGGIEWIIQKLTARIDSARGAEASIAGLVSFANLCTANNTIALIMAGPIAKDNCHTFPYRSAAKCQFIGYIFLLRTRYYPVWCANAHGFRFRKCFSVGDHAVFVLSVFVGCRRIVGNYL